MERTSRDKRIRKQTKPETRDKEIQSTSLSRDGVESDHAEGNELNLQLRTEHKRDTIDSRDPMAGCSGSRGGQSPLKATTSFPSMSNNSSAAKVATKIIRRNVPPGAVIRKPSDILCGRGIPIQTYPGNIRLHEIVNRFRGRYQDAPRHNKAVVIKEILQATRNEGARFLRRIETGQDDDYWEEVGDNLAYQKVSHALRNQKYRSERKAREKEEQGNVRHDNPATAATQQRSQSGATATAGSNQAQFMQLLDAAAPAIAGFTSNQSAPTFNPPPDAQPPTSQMASILTQFLSHETVPIPTSLNSMSRPQGLAETNGPGSADGNAIQQVLAILLLNRQIQTLQLPSPAATPVNSPTVAYDTHAILQALIGRLGQDTGGGLNIGALASLLENSTLPASFLSPQNNFQETQSPPSPYLGLLDNVALLVRQASRALVPQRAPAAATTPPPLAQQGTANPLALALLIQLLNRSSNNSMSNESPGGMNNRS